MSKRILFISPLELENPTRGTPIRFYEILRQIAKEHELHVSSNGICRDFQMTYFPYPKGSAWQRMRFFASYIRKEKIEAIFVTETVIKLAIALKFLTSVKLVSDVHGIFSGEMAFDGHIPKWQIPFWDALFRLYYSFFDLLYVVSDHLREYYRLPKKTTLTVYGGVNLKDFFPVQRPATSELVIGYSGNPRGYQGLPYLFEAAAEIKRKKLFPFKLNLVLSVDREEVGKMLQDLDLVAETTLHINVPHKEVNGIMSQSDALVIPRPSLPMTEYAYPSKLTEYLATGIPVIITRVGPVYELFSDDSMCLVIPAEDISKHLLEVLIRVARMSTDERHAIGRAARSFVEEHLTWDAAGKRINKALSFL